MKRCLCCGKELKNTHSTFCSRKCHKKYQYLDYISKWKNGLVDGGKGNWGEVSDTVRRYLFEKYNNKCSLCGWGEINPYTGKVPLEIDHINGDPMNHSEKNLRLLCPNCHSLTENYRGRNVKKGEVSGRGFKVSCSNRTRREGVKVFDSLKGKLFECEFCHNKFEPKKHSQRFCSKSCARKFPSLENKHKISSPL